MCTATPAMALENASLKVLQRGIVGPKIGEAERLFRSNSIFRAGI